MIKVTYSSIDGFRQSRSFKTLTAARRFAVKWVGEAPELGSHYAVSFDGVGKITVQGVTLAALFSGEAAAASTDGYSIKATWDGYEGYYVVYYGTRSLATFDTHAEAEEHIGICREHDAHVGQDSVELRDLECPF